MHGISQTQQNRNSGYFVREVLIRDLISLPTSRIIRIMFIIPCFAVITFLCVWLDGSAALYIQPGLDIGEALPMAAFFLLMSAYVAPDERHRDTFFAETALVDKTGVTQEGKSLSWYRVRFLIWSETVGVGANK